MLYFDFLNQIQRRLQTINQFDHDYLITDFLCPTKSQNALVVKEAHDGAEILVCIDESILKKNADLRLPYDFDLSRLPDLSIVIEELSHFNTFCARAGADQDLSSLELEVQGEVDKFAVALDWLHERNEADLKDKIFDLMFERCELGEWVKSEERARYQEAHSIARNFIRKVILSAQSPEEYRASFREFFNLPRAQKIKTSF